MSALTEEILRFGIDRSDRYDQANQRHMSVIFEGDILDQLTQNTRDNKQFRPQRERADTTL